MSTYPPNWPRCTCGEPCLDGKATCGRVECMNREQAKRQHQNNIPTFHEEDCGGVFDGTRVISDADPGL